MANLLDEYLKNKNKYIGSPKEEEPVGKDIVTSATQPTENLLDKYLQNKDVYVQKGKDLSNELLNRGQPIKLKEPHFGKQLQDSEDSVLKAIQNVAYAIPMTLAAALKSASFDYLDYTDELEKMMAEKGYDPNITSIAVAKVLGNLSGFLLPGAGLYKGVGMAGAKIGAKLLAKEAVELTGKELVKQSAKALTAQTIFKGIMKETAKAGTAEAIYGAVKKPEENETRAENAIIFGMMGAAIGGVGGTLIESVNAMRAGRAIAADKFLKDAAEKQSKVLALPVKSAHRILLNARSRIKQLDSMNENVVSDIVVEEFNKYMASGFAKPEDLQILKSKLMSPRVVSNKEGKAIEKFIINIFKNKESKLNLGKIKNDIVDYIETTAKEQGVSWLRDQEYVNHLLLNNLEYASKGPVGRFFADILGPGKKQLTAHFGLEGKVLGDAFEDIQYLRKTGLNRVMTWDDYKFISEVDDDLFKKAWEARVNKKTGAEMVSDSGQAEIINKTKDIFQKIMSNSHTMATEASLSVRNKDQLLRYGKEILESDTHMPQYHRIETIKEFVENDAKRKSIIEDVMVKNQMKYEDARDLVHDFIIKRSSREPDLKEKVIAAMKRDGREIPEAIFNDTITRAKMGFAKFDLLTPEIYKIKRAGHLEKARTVDMPGYEMNKEVLYDYVFSVIDRTAKAKVLGNNNQKLNVMLRDIESTIEYSGEKSDKLLDFYQKAIQGDMPSHKIAQFFRDWTTAAKLSPRTTMLNMGQRAVNVPSRTSMTAFTKAEKTAILESDEARRIAWESGAGVDVFMKEAQAMFSSNQTWMGKAAGFSLKTIGFTGVERWNRIVSALAGREFAKDLFNNMVRYSDDTSKSGIIKYRESERLLGELGVDVKVALRNKRLSPEDLIKAAYTVEKDTQFFSTVMDIPKWMYQFKSYGQFMPAAFQQMEYAKGYLLKEFIKGRRLPGLYFLAANAATGAAIYGTSMTMKGKKLSEQSVLNNILGVAASGPGLGMITDFFYTYTRGQYFAQGRAFGPSINLMLDMGFVPLDIIQGNYSKVGQKISSNVPIGWFPSTIVNRAIREQRDKNKARKKQKQE